MSAEVCDTLATFGAALDCVREKLQTAAIENEMATLRAELYGSFTATIEEKHQGVLARKLINERRKEEAERVSTEEQLEKRRAKAMTQRNVLVTRGCSPHGAGGAQGGGAPREGEGRPAPQSRASGPEVVAEAASLAALARRASRPRAGRARARQEHAERRAREREAAAEHETARHAVTRQKDEATW
jgi:hypothetical protein